MTHILMRLVFPDLRNRIFFIDNILSHESVDHYLIKLKKINALSAFLLFMGFMSYSQMSTL